MTDSPHRPITETLRQYAEHQLLKHRNWLRTVLQARTRSDGHTAEDILSAMTAELLRNPEQLRDVEKIEPWLYRMAVNKVTDWQRQNQRQARIHQRLALDPTQVSEADQLALLPIDLLVLEERDESIQDALDSLEEKDVEILMLKYVVQWNYEQIEHHLGIGLNKIANRLRSAKQRFKSALLNSSHADEFAEQKGVSNE